MSALTGDKVGAALCMTGPSTQHPGGKRSGTDITGMGRAVSPKRLFLYRHGDGLTLSVVRWISWRFAMLLASAIGQLEKPHWA